MVSTTNHGQKQQYLTGFQKDHAAAPPCASEACRLGWGSEGPQGGNAPFRVDQQGGAGETGWRTQACPAPQVGARSAAVVWLISNMFPGGWSAAPGFTWPLHVGHVFEPDITQCSGCHVHRRGHSPGFSVLQQEGKDV